MFGWFNTHLTELMRKPHGLNIILGPGRISTFAHFHVHVIQASFCLSSGMATVHREDRPGSECVPGQAILLAIPEVHLVASLVSKPHVPSSHLLTVTRWLSIYWEPTTCSVPFWRSQDDRGLVSSLLGGWQHGSGHSEHSCGESCPPVSMLSAKWLAFWASKPPIMLLLIAWEVRTEEVSRHFTHEVSIS